MSPIRTRRLRRPFVWLLIVQQLVAGAGVSLPCPAAAAGSAERYPCEHCGCGCGTAEQCWRDCCCFTNQQKVAWARQHGVPAPEFVVAAAERETAAAGKPKCAHCRRKAEPQSEGPAHDDCTRDGDKRGRDEDRSSGRVSWLNALRCHGLTHQWQAVTTSWPGDQDVKLGPVLLPRGCVESQPLHRYLFSPSAPPTPPPRLGSAGTVTLPVLSS